MSERRYASFLTILAIFGLLFVASWLTLEADFPAFQYSADYSRRLIPEEQWGDIATLASRYLWEHRALDLTGQAFVIVAAVVCCLALLKQTEVRH
jgi:peptidoglycan/LPS O-acetylase OafA/YrhL